MTINFGFLKNRLVCYLMLALTIIAALVVTGLNQELSKSDWAAWVQAVGSIAAIFGAYQISNRQHKRDALAEENRRRLDDARRVEIISAFIRKASLKAYSLYDADQNDRFDEVFHFRIDALKESEAALTTILPMDYPDANLALSVTILKRYLAEIIDIWTAQRQNHAIAFDFVEVIRAKDFSRAAANLHFSATAAFNKTQRILGVEV